MRKLFLAIAVLFLCLSTPAEASLQYLYPTDCADLDEKELDDGDTTSVDLTTTPTVCALEDLVGTGYEIGRVGVVVVGMLTANTPNLEVGVKIGGSTYKCDRYLGFTGTDPYTHYGCDWESSPDTSSDWTISEINGMSLSIAESGADARVTQLYAVIETDEETDNHEGVLTPASEFVKYGQVRVPYGHFWWSPSEVENLSPAGVGDAMMLWERLGHTQSEGFYAGAFGFAGSDCVTGSSGYQSVAIRVQPDGDRYEIRLNCPDVNNRASIGLYRYDDGTASTLVSPTAVAGSDVSDGAFMIVRVEGLEDPTFSVDMASSASDAVYTNIISHTDNHANAIEIPGRWGVNINEDTGDIFHATARFYGLEDSFGLPITGMPTGYSARLIDKWGQVVSTTSETSGTAVIPWVGAVTYHSLGASAPTGGHDFVGIEGYMGQIQILDGSSVVVADTGLLTSFKWGQTWEYTADYKLFDYRLGAVVDSSTYSNQRKGLVWYQLDRPGAVTVTCSPTCGNNSARYSYADNLELKQKEYVNVVILDNLDENTEYAYTVKVDGVAEGTGTLKTGPLDTEDVVPTVCFSSCINVVEVPFAIANTISQTQDCDFFLVGGDAPYTDSMSLLSISGDGVSGGGQTHMGSFYQIASAYKTYRTDPLWRDLYRNTPILFTLNDHDYCNEYSQDAVTGDVNEGTANGPATMCQGWPDEASEKVYRYYAMYGNPDPVVTEGFYYELNWGKSSNYFPDQVRERIPQSGDTEFTSFYGEGNPGPTLTNPDFEVGDSPPTGWSCFDSAGGSCSAFLSSGGAATEGSWGVLWADGSLTSIVEQAITVTANQEYIVEAVMKDSDNAYAVELRVRTDSNEAGSDVCNTAHGTSFSTFENLSCVIPDTNTDTSLYIQMKTAVDNGGQADDVRITTGELQPTCSRNGGDLSQLDCSGEAFTSETIPFSTTLGMALFDGTWYKIDSVVDADTLDMTEDIACTSCTSQTARLLKTIKSSHGRDQLYWLLNAWRGDTNPIQLFWSSYPLWGNRHVSGIYKFTLADSETKFCAEGAICGFGGEHDLLVDEMEVLEASGSGKIVLLPVGDEHKVRFSKWSTFDIYEFLVSGLSGHNAAEAPNFPEEKESDYPGLSVKLDTGGQQQWALISFNTSAKTFEIEVRNDNNRSMAWWDGTDVALGTEAWFASPRSMNSEATAEAFPEYAHNTTDGPTVVQMASGYCWKIGTNFDTSDNTTILRRTGDTACRDWISSAAYTYEFTAKPSLTAGNLGQSLILNSDETSIIISSTIDSDNRAKIRECTLTGSPPTISSCATPTSDPYYGVLGGLLWDGNGYLYTWGKKAGTGNSSLVFYVGGSSVADGIDIENPYAVSTDSVNDHHPGKVALLNSSNDLVAIWFTHILDNENAIRESICAAGGNGRCDSGEWSTPTVLVTDTNIYGDSLLLNLPDIASIGNDTAVVAYVTEANANVTPESQLKYIYYNGTSWGSPTEIPNAGHRLKTAQVFYGGEFYYIAAIDESLDEIVLFRTSDGSTWEEVDTPFESSQGKHMVNVSQIDENTVAVSYISTTDLNSYLQNDERNNASQTVVQLWTHASGRWRIKNVNPYINSRINTVN